MSPMVTALLLALLGVPPGGAPAAGHRLPGGAPVGTGAELAGPAEVLLRGGCLLRLGRAARARLAPAADGRACATVQVTAGTVRLLVAAGAGGRLEAGGTPVTVDPGDVRVTGSGAPASVCVRRGAISAPGPAPAADAPGGEGAAVAAPARVTASAGQCLPLSGGTAGPPTAAADPGDPIPGLEAPVAALPGLAVRLDLAALVRPAGRGRGRGHAGGRGGGDVETGGQSMCLETGSEGSAADPSGSGGTEVVKPLPPTRLRVTVTLERR